MKKIGLIVAGGSGSRMSSSIPKQFLLLNNVPVLIHTLNALSFLDDLLIVLPKNHFDYWKNLCKKYGCTTPHKLVSGGKSRFHSVQNGLKKVEPNVLVLIHDGVRPFVSKELITKMINALKKNTGVVPAIKLKDSIRQLKANNTKSLDRESLVKVQTPQCFYSNEIKKAYEQPYNKEFTDDASVFENLNGRIITIQGDEKNIKITTPLDLKIANVLV